MNNMLKNTLKYCILQIIKEDVPEEQHNCSAVKFTVHAGKLAIN